MHKRARGYSKYAPVAVTSSVHQTNGQQGIWLKGREFISDVGYVNNTGGAVTITPYTMSSNVLRPTDYSLFTWLASISRKFNNYKFRHLAFVYEPTCSSTETGSVGIFFDPDPSNTGPANWSAFVNTGANTHGAPWVKHGLVVPYRDFAERKEYYTKDEYPNLNAPTQPVIDPLEHYPGIYGVVTQGLNPTDIGGLPNGAFHQCGKLYLEYAISLWKSMSDSPPVYSSTQVALNPSTAQNSGVGMICKVSPDIAANIVTGSVAMFGVAAGSTTFKDYTWAGFGYFTRDATTYALRAVQNVELHYSWGGTNNAGGVPTTFRFVIDGTVYDPSAVTTPVCQEYAIAGTNTTMSVGRIKLSKGQTFAITATFTAGAGNGLKNYYLSLTPSVYGIYA